MLKRLQTSSINFFVLATSAGVFVVAYLLLQGITAARTPQTALLLATTRDLQIGDILQPSQLVEMTVYVDDTTGHYAHVDEIDAVAGAFAGLPISAGHPIPRSSLISAASAGERFSAILAQFPDHSLFPLPLDAMNVVAPPAAVFRPGDLVGITVVIRNRPPQQATPTPEAFSFTIPGMPPTELPPILPQSTSEADEAAARGYPPLAKDLFPGGIRVVGVQGLPEPVDPDNPAPAFGPGTQAEMLILLIENTGREILSLALQQGDSLFVSLLNHAGDAEETEGFTYWDFEAWFLADRTENDAP